MFSWPSILQMVQKRSWKYQTRKLPNAQKFLFLYSTLDGLVQNCMTLSQLFSHKARTFYPEQCRTLSLFYNFKVSQSTWNYPLKNHGFFCDAIFLTFAQRNIIITQDSWIRNTVSVHACLTAKMGELAMSSIHCWLNAWTGAWVSGSSANTVKLWLLSTPCY